MNDIVGDIIDTAALSYLLDKHNVYVGLIYWYIALYIASVREGTNE